MHFVGQAQAAEKGQEGERSWGIPGPQASLQEPAGL